jgi:hypothetical protein
MTGLLLLLVFVLTSVFFWAIIFYFLRKSFLCKSCIFCDDNDSGYFCNIKKDWLEDYYPCREYKKRKKDLKK